MVTACQSTSLSNPLHLNGKTIHLFGFGKVRFKRNAELAGGPKRDTLFTEVYYSSTNLLSLSKRQIEGTGGVVAFIFSSMRSEDSSSILQVQ